MRLNGRDKIISDKLKLSYSMHFNSSTNSRGVAVLIRNSLEHEIMERAADPQENILLLKMKIKGRELIIGTVYGPNDNVCENFFEFLRGNPNQVGWYTVHNRRGLECHPLLCTG